MGFLDDATIVEQPQQGSFLDDATIIEAPEFNAPQAPAGTSFLDGATVIDKKPGQIKSFGKSLLRSFVEQFPRAILSFGEVTSSAMRKNLGGIHKHLPQMSQEELRATGKLGEVLADIDEALTLDATAAKQSLSEFAQEKIPLTRAERETFGSKLGFGAGSLVRNLGVAAFAPGAAPYMWFAEGSGNAYDSVKDRKDWSEDKKLQYATLQGAWEAVSEKVGTDWLLKNPIGNTLKKNIIKNATARIAAGAGGFITEGTQEGIQQIGSNIIDNMLGDKKKLSEGVLDSVLVGAILGSVAGYAINGGDMDYDKVLTDEVSQQLTEAGIPVDQQKEALGQIFDSARDEYSKLSEKDQAIVGNNLDESLNTDEQIDPLNYDLNRAETEFQTERLVLEGRLKDYAGEAEIAYENKLRTEGLFEKAKAGQVPPNILQGIKEEVYKEYQPKIDEARTVLDQFMGAKEDFVRVSAESQRNERQGMIEPRVDNEVDIIPPGLQEETPDIIEEDETAISRKAAELSQNLQKIEATFDVEAPFRKAGAPATGLAIKTLASKIIVGEEQALSFLKDLKQTELNEQEYAELPYIIEETKQTDNLKIKKAAEMVKQTLEADFKLLEKNTVLKDRFPDSAIKVLNDQIAELKELQAPQEDIAPLREKIKALEKVKFIPLSLRVLLKNELDNGSKFLQGSSFASFKNLMGRKSASLKDLVDAGIVQKENVDIGKMVAQYKRFIYTKLAEKNIIDTAIKDGLVLPANKAPADFVDIPRKYSPQLQGHKVDPVFADYLANLFNATYSKSPGIGRITSTIKMLQFYNPLFLPINDLWQAAMLGTLQTTNLPANFKEALNLMKNKPPEYWDALTNGLASTPHKNPQRVFDQEMDKLSENFNNSIGDRITKNLERYWKSLGKAALSDLYQLSWNTAWKMDQYVRFVSFVELRKKGMTVRDAAQTAAAAHGDYAGVPVQTRQVLNKVLFTPTFKIAMGKFYGSMVKNAYKQTLGKFSEKQLDNDLKEAPDNISNKLVSKQFAKGLMWTSAIIVGKHLAMIKLGFQPKEYCRKYALRTETSEGPKDINITFATPFNILHRYYYRFLKQRPDDLNRFQRVWNGFKYELNPLWKMGIEFIENKKHDGSEIYKPFDNFPSQIKDTILWSVTSAVGILKPIAKRIPGSKTNQDRILEQAVRESSYPMLLNIMKIYSFQYGGDIDTVKSANAAKRLSNEFKRREKNYVITGDEGVDTHLDKYNQRLNNYMERLEEILSTIK